VKVGVRSNHLQHSLQRETALGLGLLPCVEILEMAVCQDFVRQGPETFGRLEIQRVGRQPLQVDACRYLHLGTDMPACVIAHQEALRAAVRTHALGEPSRRHGKGHNADGRQQQSHDTPRGRMHQGIQVAPLIAVLDESLRTLAAEALDPAQDGPEPKVV
jgi:hypothetical protein